MTRADRLYSRPRPDLSLTDPIPAATETHRTPLRSYLFEGAAIVFLLSGAAIAGSLIAKNLDHQIAACAQAKSSMVLR